MEFYKFFTALLFIGVLVIAGSEGRARGSHRRKSISRPVSNSTTNFDVLIFTQHWPPTVCYVWKEKAPSHTCLLPVDEEWTIHGIWPTQYHKIGPLYCNKSLPFEPLALTPIEDTLKTKWIDVENGTAHYSFWKHEWDKHGTCAAVLAPLSTEVKYFSKGLELLDKYDMKNILAQVSILPGNSYPVQQILDGVQSVLGKRCQVTCVSNKKEKTSYLFEVRICMDKSLQLVDCDGVPEYPTNCPLKKHVTYPGNVPNEYHVIQV